LGLTIDMKLWYNNHKIHVYRSYERRTDAKGNNNFGR